MKSPVTPDHKILSFIEAMQWCQWKRQAAEPIALVTGIFDILTAGHVRLIDFASQFGSIIVGINSDNAVKILKGMDRPINKAEDRMLVMAALKGVSVVFPIIDTSVDDAILTSAPDVWVKGSDYSMETLKPKEVAAAKTCGTTIKFAPHTGHSSTKVIQHAQRLKHE